MTELKPKAKQRGARIALAVLAGALGTALIGGTLWMTLRPEPHDAPGETAQIEPAERTEEPTLPALGASESAPATTTDSPATPTAPVAEASTTTVSADKPAATRAAKIAYRLDDKLYVANESGSGRKVVATSQEGPYALSPDATKLAWIEGDNLRVVDVGTRKSATIGPADATLAPRWVADSSALIYRIRTEDASVLHKLPKGASTSSVLTSGSEAAVSEDGTIIVVRDESGVLADGSSVVLVSVNGAPFSRVRITGGEVTAVGATNTRIFVGLAASDRGSAIVSLTPDGRDQRIVTGAIPEAALAVWNRICPSPSGLMLAVEAQGDDGYSRTFTVPAGGGTLTALAKRLDSVFRGWSSNGSRIFLLEGNAFQGEATTLVSVKPDGTAHTTIQAGAQ